MRGPGSGPGVSVGEIRKGRILSDDKDVEKMWNSGKKEAGILSFE